ncbi:MAG: VOC family protein [Streptosporangiaceae bacterium]
MDETQAGLSQDQASVDVFNPRQAQAVTAGAVAASAAAASASPASAAAASASPANAAPVSGKPADPELASAARDEPAAAPEHPTAGTIHHVELWVANLDRAVVSWGWLLTALGYRMYQDWPGGRSWRSGPAYIVVEQSPARTAGRHDRCRPGLNHLAFHAGSRDQADELTHEAQLHGWKLMFADQHPFAGGPDHYAAYLENADGFEVELVAS